MGERDAKRKDAARIIHPIPPFYDESSRILILWSFPSVKSREQQFFYGHPQNRFWKVLAGVLQPDGGGRERDRAGIRIPGTVPEKKEFLKAHHIALWDVIASCEIAGSSDASIREVTANDLTQILEAADIDAIYTNGSKAYDLYNRYVLPQTGRDAVKLPSTSPANAAYSTDRLVAIWGSALDRRNL